MSADIVQALVAIRIDRGLSQKAVAQRMWVTRPSVSVFESHKQQPRLDTLLRYAHAVGADLQVVKL